MVVERELTGFALPFASGVAAAVYFGNISWTGVVLLAAISFTLCTTLAAVMSYSIQSGGLHSEGFHNPSNSLIHYISDNYKNIPIILCGLSAGIMTGACGLLLQLSHTNWEIYELAEKACTKLSQTADSIPFEDHQTNALVKALLTGDRSSLSQSTKEIFSQSGASHILALSGLHLGIIYGVISKFMSITGKSRKAKTITSIVLILLCGLYTVITGAGPSITRAFVFIGLREFAKLTYRTTELKAILSASLIIHLSIRPESITSAGFQLSYAAMAGIAWIYPFLKNLWSEDSDKEPLIFRLLHKIWDIASLSTACQMTAGGIAWLYFGNFPEYFIITNLIAMPLSGILIPSALFTLTTQYIGICPELLITFTEKTADLLINSLTIISDFHQE